MKIYLVIKNRENNLKKLIDTSQFRIIDIIKIIRFYSKKGFKISIKVYDESI